MSTHRLDPVVCLRAKAGDADAMALLFDQARPLIRSRIYQVVGPSRGWPAAVDHQDAEQEAAEAILRAIRSWDGVRPFATLAVTCIDRRLRRWRSKTFPVVHVPERVYSRGEYHEQTPLSLVATGEDDHRPMVDRLPSQSVWGADPLELVTARCAVETHQALEDDEGDRPCGPHDRRPHSQTSRDRGVISPVLGDTGTTTGPAPSTQRGSDSTRRLPHSTYRQLSLLDPAN